MPAFRTAVGMPASEAFCRTGPTASGAARVAAIPSTLLSIAFWTRVAWLPCWGSLEYFRSMLCCSAACSAPARTRSQNVVPGCSWVTMAIVYLGPLSALLLDPLSALVLGWAPPPLQAVAVRSTPAMAAIASWRVRSIFALSVDW